MRLQKLPDESWNDFLFRNFRAQANPNFIKFLDKFFAVDNNFEKYQKGLKEERGETIPEVTSENISEDSSEDTSEDKPKKTNYLF